MSEQLFTQGQCDDYQWSVDLLTGIERATDKACGLLAQRSAERGVTAEHSRNIPSCDANWRMSREREASGMYKGTLVETVNK